jgi:SAM-dependent methyltransferase
MIGAMNESTNGVEYLASCPGCGGENLSVLEPGVEHKIFLTDADEMLVTTGVCGCEQCGLTFLNPRMSQKKLFEYYSKQSRIPRDSIESDSPFAAHMKLQIDEIEKFKPISKGMRVLEIGCAEGLFLQGLEKRANEKLKLYGVELSEKYIAQAKKILPDVTVFEKPLEETEFDLLKFDLVILRHVLEHLGNPLACLEKVRSILAPEGVLYIEVPDSRDTNPSMSRFYHHEHLLYFTTQILSSYLQAAGLDPLVCERFDANPVGSGFSYPVIKSVSAAGKPLVLGAFPGHAKDVYLQNKIRNTAHLESLLAPVRRRLHELKATQMSIGLFGAGPHTMDLLELLEVENIQWVKVFDNNPNKQGKSMRGIPIVKPDENTLKSVDCVLVSSAEFEKEMVAQVRALAGTQVEIITLYDNDASC